MARVVSIAAVVIAIAALLALLRDTNDQPAAISSIGESKQTDSATLVDEVEVLVARRSITLNVCETPDPGQSIVESETEWEHMEREMLRVLRTSADAEHLLVAALVSWRDNPDQALQLLGEAAAREPRDPLIASQTLELCLETDACSHARPQLERNLAVADKGNILAWVQIARSRLARKDDHGALAALREAAAAAVVEDYFTEYVMMFDRALAASYDLPAHDRMVAAFGHAVAASSGAYMISADCRERAPNSAEWSDVCLRLGERFEHDSRTLLLEAIGIGIQASMYELSGDTRSYEQALKRQQEFQEEYKSVSPQSSRAEELKDATVYRRYLEIFATAGELEAMMYLADEVAERLPTATNVQQSSCRAP